MIRRLLTIAALFTTSVPVQMLTPPYNVSSTTPLEALKKDHAEDAPK